MVNHHNRANTTVSLKEIEQIIQWTKEDVSRYEISRRLNRAVSTIWRYQKLYSA